MSALVKLGTRIWLYQVMRHHLMLRLRQEEFAELDFDYSSVPWMPISRSL